MAADSGLRLRTQDLDAIYFPQIESSFSGETPNTFSISFIICNSMILHPQTHIIRQQWSLRSYSILYHFFKHYDTCKARCKALSSITTQVLNTGPTLTNEINGLQTTQCHLNLNIKQHSNLKPDFNDLRTEHNTTVPAQYRTRLEPGTQHLRLYNPAQYHCASQFIRNISSHSNNDISTC